MTSFFWASLINEAYELQKKENRTLAKLKTNPDFNDDHEGWCKDAQRDEYTLLDKATKEKINSKIKDVNQRRKRKRQSTFQLLP